VFPSQPLRNGQSYSIWAGAMVPSGSGAPTFVGKTLSVTVTAQTSNAWVFTTDPAHHFFNGTIAFVAADAGNGNVTFSVTADANWASNWYRIPPLAQIITGGENSTWNNLLDNVQAYCK